MRVTAEQAKLVKEGVRTPPTGLDLALDILTALVAVLALAYLVVVWPGLPERVPTHFDVAGNPDAFGPRSEILWLAACMVALTGVLYTMRFTPPRLWNVPFAVTDGNAKATGRILARFSRLMNLVCTTLFAVLLVSGLRVALGQATGLSPLLVAVGVVLPFGAVVWMLVVLGRLGPAPRRRAG